MSLAIFSSVGIWEILILMLVLLLVFGSRRLPQIGRSVGQGLREFKDSVGDTGRELKAAIGETPGEVKSAYGGETAPEEQLAPQQAALPAESRTVEAPVATPVSDGQPAQAPADPPGPTSSQN